MNAFLMFDSSLYSFKFGAPASVSDTISFNIKLCTCIRTPADIPHCSIAKEQEGARQGAGNGVGSCAVKRGYLGPYSSTCDS